MKIDPLVDPLVCIVVTLYILPVVVSKTWKMITSPPELNVCIAFTLVQVPAVNVIPLELV
jgi:hypothetical protein